MTFLLVSVVYATAVAKPGHGNLAPLAIGFTLFASAFVGAPCLQLMARFCSFIQKSPLLARKSISGPTLLNSILPDGKSPCC